MDIVALRETMQGIFGSWLATDPVSRLGLICFIYALFYASVNIYWLRIARSDAPMPKIRRIAGLDALDEAIGRSTEMGRPIIYTTGMEGLTPPTFASLTVLGYVAKSVVRYDTRMIVAMPQVILLPICENIVRQAYIEEGKPDAFRPDDVRFLTNDQLGYATGVVGTLIREKAASSLMFGMFQGEALIFCEAGFIAGAIQIAGTTSNAQLPFFIATCDYTLIGEELYAASAYLGKDRVRTATLIAQDWGKTVVIAAIALGMILSTFNITILRDLMTLY
jgi:hypothetical protein